MARRSFGSIIDKDNGYEARYRPPIQYADKYPNLPERISRRFPQGYKLEAESWLAQEETLVRLGEWTPPQVRKTKRKSKGVLFHDYATQWIEQRRKPDGTPIGETTRQKYREYLKNHLDPAFGMKPVADITGKDIIAWHDTFPTGNHGRGETVLARCYTMLKAILETAATQPLDDTGQTLIERNPATLRISRPRTKHRSLIAELDELDQLTLLMPETLQLAIPLAGIMGLREGEICGLQRRDVDIERRILHVRHSVKPVYDSQGHRALILGSTKTESSVRDLTIPEFLMEPIKRQLERYSGDAPDSMLIPGRNGGMLAPQSLRNAWNRVRGQVPRLADMHFHDLRHTALTRLAEMGATGGELMAQAGHTSLKVASIYQQASDKHREEVLRRLEDAVKPVNPVEADRIPADDLVTRLESLARLHDADVLDDDEFKQAKRKILDTMK